MRKTELYQSIDGIKQDKYLKERILKAADERDEIVVIRRPMLVPAMIAFLLCLNVGMLAKLVIFNKSQVNISEFKAKTSISDESDSETESRPDELEKIMQKEEEQAKQLEKAEKEQKEQQLIESQREADRIQNEVQQELEYNAEKAEQEARFYNAKEKFIAELENNDYRMVAEWYSPEEYRPDESLPCFFNESADTERGAYPYRRYVEVIDIDNDQYENLYTGSLYSYDAATKTSVFGCAYTNHEYIIGYDGNGYEYENIISITESNDVKIKEYDMERIINAGTDMETYQKALALTDNYINSLSVNVTDKYLYPSELFFMYPSDSNEYGADLFIKYYAELAISHQDTPISVSFLITPDGNDVTEVLAVKDNYWKETVYAPVHTFPTVQVPDITGMPVSEAEKMLEDAGLRIGSRTYYAISDTTYKYGDVMGMYPKSGTKVFKGSEIGVEIRGVRIAN